MPDDDRLATSVDAEPEPSVSSAAGDARAAGLASGLVDAVRRLLRDTLDVDVPSPDSDLIEGGLIDSLALVELLFELERTFDVDVMVDELEIEHFRSVASIADFVAARRTAPRWAP